jgi:hypothetical protein
VTGNVAHNTEHMFSIQEKSAEDKKTKRSVTPPPAAYGGIRVLRTAPKGTGIDHTTKRDDYLAGENPEDRVG